MKIGRFFLRKFDLKPTDRLKKTKLLVVEGDDAERRRKSTAMLTMAVIAFLAKKM